MEYMEPMTREEFIEDFTRHLRSELERSGMTQAELASKAGISTASMSRYLNGERIPSAYIEYKLFSVLIDTLI